MDLTLVFSSLVLVFIEIWCAFSLVKGRNWRAGSSPDANYRHRLSLGGLAGVRLSGAVQYCRRVKT
jgi:hypothetical protein